MVLSAGCRGSVELSTAPEQVHAKIGVDESGCQHTTDGTVCYVAGVEHSFLDRLFTEDKFGLISIYLKFEGTSAAGPGASRFVSGYVFIGGAHPLADHVWEITEVELSRSDGGRVSGVLRCDKALVVPRNREPTSAQVLLRSIPMRPLDTVMARVKEPATLRRIPAMEGW